MAREENDVRASSGGGLQPETLIRGGITAGIIAVLLGVAAWFIADRRAEGPLDAYRRQGNTAGAAMLQRDLLAQYPPASGPVPLVRRLEGMDFTCRPAESGWSCLHQELGDGRRVWRAEVAIGLANGAVGGITARISETAPP